MPAKKKPDVWAKLARAFDRKTGCRLTAYEVGTLVLMDTAVRDAIQSGSEDERAGSTFERVKRERLKPE